MAVRSLSPPGGTVTLSSDVTRQGELKITVEDEGPGIPKEDLPRVFERFYRVDKARSRRMGGTGLGLPIAKTIVDAHSGHITAESRPGHGTRMSIHLPLVPDEAGVGLSAAGDRSANQKNLKVDA